MFAAREQYGAAINTYMEALEHSPESPDLLSSLGLLLLRVGDGQRAFDQLGKSLLHNPRSARAILAIGSIIQVRRRRGGLEPDPLQEHKPARSHVSIRQLTPTSATPERLHPPLFPSRTTKTMTLRWSSTAWRRWRSQTAPSCGTTSAWRSLASRCGGPHHMFVLP